VELFGLHGAFDIRSAVPADFPELVALRRLEDWAPNAWLFSAIETSGLGNIVVARRENRAPGRPEYDTTILASAVATAYGPIGIVGNVIVHASHRAKGLGRAVMEAELAWLHQRGVTHVELDATEHGRPLYDKLGFVTQAPSWMLVERAGSIAARHLPAESPASNVQVLSPEALASVGALDRQAFGGDRMPLLTAVLALEDTRGWVVRDASGNVAGYIFVRPAEHRSAGLRIGPWIARSPRAALDLLTHAVASSSDVLTSDAPVLASVPGASSTVTGTFAELGMPLVPDDVRMRLTFAGPEPSLDVEIPRADWVYGMLAPMVG
jgi:GNAT superfamily N-acetyltransferase